VAETNRVGRKADGHDVVHTLRVRLLHVLGLGGLGPWQLTKRVTRSALANDCLGQAAKIAYSLLFALFPFLIFLTSVPAFLPVPSLLDQVLEAANRVVPLEALELVQTNLRDLLTRERSGLLAVTLLVALGAGSGAVMAVMDSLNRAYGIRERRPAWLVQGTALLLTIGLTVFGIAAVTFGTGVGAWLAHQADIGPGLLHTFADPLRWPVVVVLLMFGVAVIYYFGPDLRQGWRWVTPGAIFAVIGWIVASVAFSRYVGVFGRYNQLHGSIGAVILLLTWMYMTGLFVILGGEINAKIEHASPHGRAPGRRWVRLRTGEARDAAEAESEERGARAKAQGEPSRVPPAAMPPEAPPPDETPQATDPAPERRGRDPVQPPS
jgi:membrane protein